MPFDATWPLSITSLALTALAARTDSRAGVIPNWLTLPPLVLAPLARGLCFGPAALGLSVLAALLCALPPLLVFLRGAMGGGDVKLFAALGALLGVHQGLCVQLLAYAFASVPALAQLLMRRVRAESTRTTEADAAGRGEVRLGVPIAAAWLYVEGLPRVLEALP